MEQELIQLVRRVWLEFQRELSRVLKVGLFESMMEIDDEALVVVGLGVVYNVDVRKVMAQV
jgi:hypothetical protein